MSEIRIKRGETLRLMFTFTDDHGVPIDLSTVMLAAQVRAPNDDLVAVLPIVVTDVSGVATVQVADTAQWPLGLLRSDIKLLTGGLPVLSDTFGIRVNRAVTQ